jgi:hypothetical protein
VNTKDTDRTQTIAAGGWRAVASTPAWRGTKDWYARVGGRRLRWPVCPSMERLARAGGEQAYVVSEALHTRATDGSISLFPVYSVVDLTLAKASTRMNRGQKA